MLVFPIAVMLFFTTLMGDGQPVEMPIGVVDLDNTSTSRNIIRRLDAFQTSHVVARFPSEYEARQAIQTNQIYAYIYIPKGTTDQLLASRQPKISFYYSMTTMVAPAQNPQGISTTAQLQPAKHNGWESVIYSIRQ